MTPQQKADIERSAKGQITTYVSEHYDTNSTDLPDVRNKIKSITAHVVAKDFELHLKGLNEKELSALPVGYRGFEFLLCMTESI
ncbi:hypothetical protein ACU684_09715 [Pseudomonas sp. LF135]